MANIKLNSKYGINTSLDICFWCGESKGVILFKKLAKDKEVPMKCVSSYDPCDTCKELWTHGVLLIEVAPKSNSDIVEIVKDHIPTGRHWLIKREALVNIFPDTEHANVLYVLKEVAEILGLYGETNGI